MTPDMTHSRNTNWYSWARGAVLLPALALLQACSSLVALPPASSLPADDPLTAPAAEQAWSRVLSQHVDAQGRVDFKALAAQPADLHALVRYIAQVKATDLPDRQAQLAHHINSYNALSMFNVIDLGIPISNASLLARYRFFIARTFTIGGERLSLFDYENKIIRAFNEPRIHWALNCSAVSCPQLPREPFEAARLNEQLDREARRFFSMPSNLRVEPSERAVYATEILSFFTEDFTPRHAPSLIDYINRYIDKPIDPSYTIRFIPYDWTIASQPPR
jgi:hypothetical protein